MLTGRESLLRLIGKRRRILPNPQSLLSTQLQRSLDLPREKNGGVLSSLRTEGSSGHEMDVSRPAESGNDRVTCPVCGNTVPGANYMLNTHLGNMSHFVKGLVKKTGFMDWHSRLHHFIYWGSINVTRMLGSSCIDACLTRGTKRKMSQCTLLQLNFCSRSKDEIHSIELNNKGANVMRRCPDNNPLQNSILMLPDCAVKDNDGNQCTSPSNAESTVETYLEVSVENPTRDDIVYYKELDTPSLHPNSKMTELDIGVSIDDISGAILETFIVGRRFNDEVELKQGASVYFVRDPNNVKDPNAIKVLSSDSGTHNVLGFLPRELARYISPLIEKYCMNFEGCVTSLPKHSLDVVPIQIVCQEMTLHGEKESNDVRLFESLWKNAVHVVENAKAYPPSMTKYQQNFCLLVQEVLRNHPHLFTDDEKLFLESFKSLSDDSQRLFIRLYTRKGPWFRMSNISYPEILDSRQAIKGLSATGYICSLECMNELHDKNMKEVLDLLTVSELREISCSTLLKDGAVDLKDFRPISLKGNHRTRRQDLIALLLASYEDGMCPLLPSMVLDRTGTCVQISSTADLLLWRAQRLFFLNGEQDLSSFLLVDLGLVKYPDYNCIISSQIFPGRSDLLAYEEAIEVAQIMDQSLDENNTEMVTRCIEISDTQISSSHGKATQSSIPKSGGTFLSSLVYNGFLDEDILFEYHQKRQALNFRLLHFCWWKYNNMEGQEARYGDAISLLRQLLTGFTCDGRRGYWTLRLSIDLEHMGHLNESLFVAEEGLLDSWVRAGSRLALQRRVLRLGKPPRRWKTPSFAESVKRKIKEVHIQGRPLNCGTGLKSRFYSEDGEQCGVEQLALQYYAGEGGGWQGVHTESGIWLTIFGLLMWDIIFADVSDVFRTKFQTAPLDLETDNFYILRKSLIEPHLHKIHSGMAEEILITSWESHIGTACRGVNWDRHSLFDLRAAVTSIGGPCVASLCRHLAQDYRSWSSGMPDLLLWRFCGDYRGEAKLVEVKGPRDRLSEQQRAWLLLLMDCGFNTEVCKVNPEPQCT
ncbi:hypothetical protein HHK36_027245 [Tetracentron sinense]|uniref:Fanconi-associated nuclease n=1 Tax=Tetracentron sinense TaxID=13715 RepID=A0A834YID5_TETSI|nr:hypothetical protein HHK36_027245 [Tetracentron sinense]